MISKELLSEVFNRKVRTLTIVDNKIYFQYEDVYYGGISGIDDEEINIYELAYKCKEWAYNQGYTIDIYNKSDGLFIEISKNTIGTYLYKSLLFDLKNEQSELFKACQWILKN